MTDIKEKIEELAEKIMKDSALQAQFKKDPVKAVEQLQILSVVMQIHLDILRIPLQSP